MVPLLLYLPSLSYLGAAQVFFAVENCVGGAAKPADKFNISCSCDPGNERLDSGVCSACSPGTFNAGGISYDWSVWGKWNSTQPGNIYFPAEGVTMYCEGAGCRLWTPGLSDGELSSGNHKDVNSIVCWRLCGFVWSLQGSLVLGGLGVRLPRW
jgi:hypothetical protein